MRSPTWSEQTLAMSALPSEEQDEADDDEADPAGRGVDERQEDGEEQEGRAEVALDDDDAERDRPHRDHRGEVRQRRQAERPEPGVLLDEQRPVLRQVAGQEDDEDDLEQLRRLAAERPDAGGSAAGRRSPSRRRTPGAGGRCRPPPTCTCSGAASRRSGRRSPRVVGDSDPEHQPDELDLRRARASCRRTSLVTRSWGSRCMSSSEMPAEHAHRRQQHLVRPPPGQDLRQVRQRRGRRGR